MIHAFGVAFGAIIGTAIGTICAAGIVLTGVILFDWWAARIRQKEYQRNPWDNAYVPGLFDPQPEQPPKAPPREEIEDWWYPMDPFDR